MIRFARSSLLAAMTVGLMYPAAVGRAASPSASNSQLTLVSATEDQPQAADPSSVRLGDPRVGTAPAEQPIAPAAPKPATRQPVAAQTAKPAGKAPRPATTARKPAPRPATAAPRSVAKAPPRQPTPSYYPQRGGVAVSANIAIEPGRRETVMRPAAPPALAPSPEPMPEQMSAPSPEMGPPPSPEVDTSIGGCAACPTCCESCCGFCAGAEYLFLRPHFADDEAFQQMTATTTPTTVTQVNQLVNFDEPYNSDYHFFVGYHTACGDEFRLGYWHLADDGNRSGTASGNFLAGAGTAFQAPDTTELTAAGETINATTHMALNMYDFDDVKHLELPNFGCGCCPGWDVHWSYGMRLIDFRHTEDDFTPFETVNNSAAFVGAGPKLGLDVRRQLGHSKFSVYVSATAALLLGEQRARSTSATPGVLQTAVAIDQAHEYVVIPDFNISAGLTWQPWCHTTITGGWMFEDFGDLGGAPCLFCNSPTGTISGGDLSFEGLFIRAEHCF